MKSVPSPFFVTLIVLGHTELDKIIGLKLLLCFFDRHIRAS
jgi:hypothetical protein